MSDISVKRFRVVGIGKPVVDLVDFDDCIADPLASLYLTTKERLSHNTVLRQAYELRFFLLWCESNKIPLYPRIKSLDFITDLEVRAFVQHARSDASSSNVLFMQKLPSDKYLDNALNQIVSRTSKVSIGCSNGRLSRVMDYLSFCHNELNRHKLHAVRSDRLQRVLKLLSGSLEREKGRFELSRADTLRNDNDFRSVVSTISGLQKNLGDSPFSHLTRKRNNLILDLIIDVGIRRASIAKLKISHILFEGHVPKIWIADEVNDLSDPRPNKPEQKTQQHFCYPNPDVMEKLKEYIERDRPKLLNKKSGEFVFLVEKNSKGSRGDPISLNTINYIFERLSTYSGIRLHPHKLRHVWNLKFSELSKSGEYSEYEIDKARRILMGWTPTSEMPSVYNRAAEVERAQELARKLQKGEI